MEADLLKLIADCYSNTDRIDELVEGVELYVRDYFKADLVLALRLINHLITPFLSHLPQKDRLVLSHRLIKENEPKLIRTDYDWRDYSHLIFYRFPIRKGEMIVAFLSKSTPFDESQLDEIIKLKRPFELLHALVNRENTSFDTEIVRTISREIKVPLNSIYGFGQLININLEQSWTAKVRDFANRIVGSSRQILTILEDFTTLNRIEQLEIEKLSIRSVFKSVIDTIHSSLTEKEVVFNINYRHTDYLLMSNSRYLQQSLVYLLLTAIDNIPMFGEIDLKIDYHPIDSTILIRIKDNGTRVHLNDVDHIFDPFHKFRETDGRTYTNGGLRIATVIEMTKMLNIVVEYNREHVVGNEYLLTCLLADCLENQLVTTDDTGDDVSEVTRPKRDTIISIEDNRDNAELLERLISGFSCDFTNYIYGRDGLQAVKFAAPTVVFLDVNLPDISGIEILAELKADPKLRELPIYMITADATSVTREKIKKLGATALLTKPIDVLQIIGLLEKHFERK